MNVTGEKIERLMERTDVEYDVAKEALEAADGSLLDAVIALEREGKFGPNAGGARSAAYSTAGGSPAAAVGQSYSSGVPQTRVEPNFTMGAGMAAQREADKKKNKKKNKPKGGSQGAYYRAEDRYGAGQYGQGGQYGQSGQGGQGGQYGQYGQGGQYGQYGQSGQHGQYGKYNDPHRYRDESTEFEDNLKRFFRWLGRVFRAGLVNYFEIWRGGERIMHFPVILFLFCLIYWVLWVVFAILLIGLFCGCRYRFSGPHLGRKSVNDAKDNASENAEEVKDGEDPYS